MSNYFDITRRHFIQNSAALLASATMFAAFAPYIETRSLALHNLNTGESLNAIYWRKGRYDPPAIREINTLMRDHETDATFPIHTHLLDLLSDLQMKFDNDNPIEIFSAYRKGDLGPHGKGLAIDIRLPGVRLPQIYKTAYDMHKGDVGYYPDSPFVHIDVRSII